MLCWVEILFLEAVLCCMLCVEILSLEAVLCVEILYLEAVLCVEILCLEAVLCCVLRSRR